MKFVFIINPTSGNGKSIKAMKAIEECCQMMGVEFYFVYTSRPGDAKDIANHFKNRDNFTIFSVGGDGTLNEVVNGLANSNTKLGLIPVGTGNDFYKSLKDFNEDKIDLGKVNDKYFLNVASIGLDAEIANYANELKKHNLPNDLIYILGIMHEYFSFKPIKIDVDGINKDSTIFTVCNAKYYGGGFNIAPYAELNDGLFDIVDIKAVNKLKIIDLIAKLTKGNHLDDDKVKFYRTDQIRIESRIPLNCNIDGEIFKDTKFNFSIEKESLNVDIENSKKINEFLKIKKIIK